MSSRDTYISSIATAHASATTGGITFNTGATVAPARNATTWSVASAKAAFANGDITASQYFSVLNAIEGWRQSQIQSARDTLRSTGDLAPL